LSRQISSSYHGSQLFHFGIDKNPCGIAMHTSGFRRKSGFARVNFLKRQDLGTMGKRI
jgi:hypothetical protein